MIGLSKYPVFRWVWVAVIVALFGALAAWIFIPKVISTDGVLERFKAEVSATIGHSITFDEKPEIKMWPTATVTLRNLKVGEVEHEEEEFLLLAESFSSDLNIWSVLIGEPTFSNHRLVRPNFQFEIYPDGTSNWFPSTQMSHGKMQKISSSIASTPTLEKASFLGVGKKLLDLSQISIESGTLLLISDPGGEPERITSINGTLEWPDQSSVLSTNLDAIVRGEEINLAVTGFNPTSLLEGGTNQIGFDLRSAMVNVSYNGSLLSAETLFADGKLQLDSPSVRRALEWSGNDIKPGAALGSIELTADLAGTMKSVKFEDLIIKIGENRGVGILEYKISENAPPLLGGTLAFNNLDIQSFFKAFTPLPKSGDDIANTIDTRFLKQLGLDLRLSAQTANFGPIDMTNLAAAVQVNKEEATFNVGTADAYNGQVMGKISISESGIDGGGEISLSARHIGFDQLFDAIETRGPLPRGVGDMDIKLSSDRPLWATSVDNIRGEFSIHMADGLIPDVNIDLVKELSRQSRFQSLSDLNGNSIYFQSAELNARINAGVAHLDKAFIQTADERIMFYGAVPFAKGSMALFGSIIELSPEENSDVLDATSNDLLEASKPSTSVFIGGSWPDPIISPPVSENFFQ